MKLLKSGYEKIWVPVLGRILMYFSSLIEGKKISEKPSYKFDEDKFDFK